MNYKTYHDSTARRDVRYQIIAAPSFYSSASINFAINNRLEAKVRTKAKDDEDDENFKKIVILESFSISSFYDFMRDSLRLEPITINGRTTLFKYINLGFSLRLDPYAYEDSLATRTNVFELKKNNRLFRVSSTAWNLSCGLNINKDFFKSEKKKAENKEVTQYGFKDWSISLTYTFSYNMADNLDYYRHLKINPNPLKYTHEFTNVLNISGRFALTPKWALEIRNSGYDFKKKEISASEFTVERDLHCWLMKFTVCPFGTYRKFEFFISAKANIIKDIAKWEQVKVVNE
jgi:hypothetical protein